MELHAKYTLIAEGVRGSLAKQLMAKFDLRDGVDPQKFGIGIKELWQVDRPRLQEGPGRAHAGLAAVGDRQPAAARFMYHFGDNLVAIGFVVHLNYENPYLSPFDEFQRFKTHPEVAKYLQGRQAPGLRLARHQRGRPAVGAEAHLPGRRADRLLGGLRQRAAHQGQPQRDEERHAGAPRPPSRRWRRARPAATS